MSSQLISFTVTHRGTAHPLALLPDSTLSHVYARLEELTGVPPSLQKLLYKGKKTLGDDATIQQAGIINGLKVQMLGSTLQEMDGLKAVEDEQQKRNRIMRERALKAPAKVCGYGSPTGWVLNYHVMKRRFDQQVYQAALQ
jgi:hypothetical protein